MDNLIEAMDSFGMIVGWESCHENLKRIYKMDEPCWLHGNEECKCLFFNLYNLYFIDDFYAKILKDVSMLNEAGIKFLGFDDIDFTDKITFFKSIYYRFNYSFYRYKDQLLCQEGIDALRNMARDMYNPDYIFIRIIRAKCNVAYLISGKTENDAIEPFLTDLGKKAFEEFKNQPQWAHLKYYDFQRKKQKEELLKNAIPTQKPEEPFEFFYTYAGIVIGTTKEIKND